MNRFHRLSTWCAILALGFLCAAPRAQSDPVSTERARRDLLAQKTFVLVQRYMSNARAFEARLDFERAERELVKARDIDPKNRIVLDYLRQVQTMLGRPQAEAATLSLSAADRYKAHRQQMKVQALQDLSDTERALAVEDFERAVTLSRGVVQRIEWTRNEIDWSDVEPRARQLLANAESQATLGFDSLLRDRQEQAYQQLHAEEQRINSQRDERLTRMLDSAADHFIRDDFQSAEELAQAVLREDRYNPQAIEMLDAARDASREYASREAIRDRKEEFRRWRESMESVRVPYDDILTNPDPEHWAEITAKRGNGLSLPQDPEVMALEAELRSKRMDADFTDMTLTQVANNIYFASGVPVSVDPEVATELDDAAELVNLSGLRNLPVESLLNILTEQVGDELAWTIRNGRVYITKQEKAQGDAVVRVHNIQDLTFPITDFKGTNIRDIPLPGEAGDDNETTIFSSELDQVQLIPPEEILNLVRENIERDSWDESDSFNIDFLDNNNLLVIHTPETQRKVAAFLNDLRRFSTSMVTLETRFFALVDGFIEEIGTDLRGLGPGGQLGDEQILDDVDPVNTQGLDNFGDGSGNPNAGIFYDDDDQFYSAAVENFFQNPLGSLLSTVGGGAFQFTILDDTQINIVLNLVEKSVNAIEITSPIVSVFNTQRAFVTVVNQVSFVQGYDVDVANAARIADPNIGIVQEGIVLDVRPTISFDRKYVMLDVQSTVANLTRPIRRFQTNLGGGTDPVEFQLPELEVQDAQTTAVVPDGGSVILGGFKHVLYRNRTAESPFFSQIPFLGFFFREKGLADEMTDLIIVIKVNITDYSLLQDQPVAR